MKRKTVYEFRAYRFNNLIADRIWRTASTKKGIYRKLANLPTNYECYGVFVVRTLVARNKLVKIARNKLVKIARNKLVKNTGY